jgi:hypothetical protein
VSSYQQPTLKSTRGSTQQSITVTLICPRVVKATEADAVDSCLPPPSIDSSPTYGSSHYCLSLQILSPSTILTPNFQQPQSAVVIFADLSGTHVHARDQQRKTNCKLVPGANREPAPCYAVLRGQIPRTHPDLDLWRQPLWPCRRTNKWTFSTIFSLAPCAPLDKD